MIEVSNSKYKERIEEYHEQLKDFLNDPYDDEDEEIYFIMPKLGAHIYALQIATLNKEFVELVKNQQTQYFEISDNSARMHLIQIKLIYLNNCGVSMDKLIEAVYDFDEQTKKFKHEEIEFVIKTYFYSEDGGIKFERRDWIKSVRSLSKFCKWLHTRKEQIISGEILEIEQYSKIAKLDFNINQTDLVHFFDLLVDADIIKEPEHEVHKTLGGFYGKLAEYFTAKGKTLNPKSAKTIKTNKVNKGTPYSQSYFDMLKNLQKTIDKKLNSQSLP